MPAESALARVAERFRGERAPLGDPEQRIRELLAEEAPLLTADEAAGHSSRLLGDLVGLGPLEPLLADESVTDVFVNGPGRVWIEREGTLVCTEVVVDRAQLSSAIERIVSPLGLRSDRSHPIVDARRADGTRVAVVLPPVAPDGPLLALRRHRGAVLSLGDFGPPAVVEILETVVQRG
ncbi:MAG: Flp pilus assembly complex ATPase component TadA, partial [Microthrixaceae bacterium]|nr:Flp pilus assembly complex ATPase component TadA [Microthrixaceae bacterium]